MNGPPPFHKRDPFKSTTNNQRLSWRHYYNHSRPGCQCRGVFAPQERGIIVKTISEIRKELEAQKGRSAWQKGVIVYAFELLDNLEENRDYNKADKHIHPLELKTELLNGASSWVDYSWGGSSLCYDCDIAERLCCPSELKKSRNGERKPNGREEWLDVQARALCQAYNLIIRLAR